jgi:hypothetical protein
VYYTIYNTHWSLYYEFIAYIRLGIYFFCKVQERTSVYNKLFYGTLICDLQGGFQERITVQSCGRPECLCATCNSASQFNEYYLHTCIKFQADHSSRAVWGMKCLRSLEHWDRGFESHSRHGCLSLFILCLCCPVLGSGLVTGWSPVQRILPTVFRLRNWKSVVFSVVVSIGSVSVSFTALMFLVTKYSEPHSFWTQSDPCKFTEKLTKINVCLCLFLVYVR